MKKIVIGLLLILSVFFLSFCAKPKTTQTVSTPSSQNEAKKLKFGLVTDMGGLGDQSFNDSAYRGLKKVEKELNCEIKVIESREAADYETNLANLAEDHCDLIFATGILMTDALKKVARKYAQTKFGIIDGNIPDFPNVISCVFKEEEGSFLAGALAGLQTKKNKLGFIGGMKIPLIEKFEAGFKAGIKTVNPKAVILVGYAGRFDDPGKGKELALAQFAQGADIVYHAAGGCGIGVIEAAKEKGKGFFAVGVDSNQDHLAKGRVLTSMIKSVDLAVFETCKNFKQGKYKSGLQIFGIKENGVSLSPMEFTKNLISKINLKKLEELKEKIKNGKITVPDNLEKLKIFKS